MRNDDFDSLDVITSIAKNKFQILLSVCVGALCSLLIALILPNYYTASTAIMPPQEDYSNTTALVGQLLGNSGLGGAGGFAGALGLRNPNDLYVGLIKSQSISDRLIERFKLQDRYLESSLVDTREELQSRTSISAGQDGLIRIEHEDQDPQFAALIANSYVEELEALTARVAVTEAARRRVYYQKQVDQARAALIKADVALKATQEETGLIRPDAQTGAALEALSKLRAQIAAKEIEMSALSTFATRDNPDYVRAKRELDGMRTYLSQLERSDRMEQGVASVAVGKLPEVALAFLQRWRDVKYLESVTELLTRQLEAARIDEGRNATIIQIVDVASAPDKKSGPPRALITLAGATLVGFVALLWFLLRDYIDNSQNGPALRERWRRVRSHLFT